MPADIRMLPWSIARLGLRQLHKINDWRYETGYIDEAEHDWRAWEIQKMALANIKGRDWLYDHGYLTEERKGK